MGQHGTVFLSSFSTISRILNFEIMSDLGNVSDLEVKKNSNTMNNVTQHDCNMKQTI